MTDPACKQRAWPCPPLKAALTVYLLPPGIATWCSLAAPEVVAGVGGGFAVSRCNGELSGGIHPACEDALFLVSVLGHYRMLMEGRVDETAELLNL